MTTSLSPELNTVLRALGVITEFKPAPKFKIRGGMLYIGDFGAVELRLVQTAPGYEVSVVLERLKSPIHFRIGIGSPMQNYGLIAEQRFQAAGVDVTFFSLPDGFFAPEFIEAFTDETAAQNLAAVHAIGWSLVIASQQIEVVVPLNAAAAQITFCMERVLELATHAPFAQR